MKAPLIINVGPDLSGITAAAAQILSDYQSVDTNGAVVNGSMTNRGAVSQTITPSTSQQSYTISAGYHNGSGSVTVPAVKVSYGNVNFSSSASFTITGLGFTPITIIIACLGNAQSAASSSYDCIISCSYGFGYDSIMHIVEDDGAYGRNTNGITWDVGNGYFTATSGVSSAQFRNGPWYAYIAIGY